MIVCKLAVKFDPSGSRGSHKHLSNSIKSLVITGTQRAVADVVPSLRKPFVLWHGTAGIFEVPCKYTHTLYMFVYKGRDHTETEVDKDWGVSGWGGWVGGCDYCEVELLPNVTSLPIIYCQSDTWYIPTLTLCGIGTKRLSRQHFICIC